MEVTDFWIGLRKKILDFWPVPKPVEQFFLPWLEKSGYEKPISFLWADGLLESTGLFLVFVFLTVVYPIPEELVFLSGMGTVCFPFMANFLLLVWKTEQQKREMEEESANWLLACSAFPRGTETGLFLRWGAREHFGAWGKELGKMDAEMRHGASVEIALQHCKQRCNSRIIDRVLDLVLTGYESGADLSLVFREAAEDLFETRLVLQERQAALLVEKYTILLAGGLIVPIVLGLVSGMMQQLDFSALSALELGLAPEERLALLEAALAGTHVYLVLYAVIAAFFVALQEGNWKKGIGYAVVLVPMGVLGFWLAQGA